MFYLAIPIKLYFYAQVLRMPHEHTPWWMVVGTVCGGVGGGSYLA